MCGGVDFLKTSIERFVSYEIVSLAQIAERVSEINARISVLHNATMAHLNETERATLGVQEAMRASDAATDLVCPQPPRTVKTREKCLSTSSSWRLTPYDHHRTLDIGLR